MFVMKYLENSLPYVCLLGLFQFITDAEFLTIFPESFETWLLFLTLILCSFWKLQNSASPEAQLAGFLPVSTDGL